ncbi:MAG: hypothetical protein WD604_07565 [Balneolaceae bacterium]
MITGDLDLTTDTSFRANIQYDNLSERAGYLPASAGLCDLFLVYTHNWMYEEEDRFSTLEYGGAMKVTYTQFLLVQKNALKIQNVY